MVFDHGVNKTTKLALHTIRKETARIGVMRVSCVEQHYKHSYCIIGDKTKCTFIFVKFINLYVFFLFISMGS